MATTYTARFWDKASAINGCPAEKAIESFQLTDSQKLGILSTGGRDCITQTFPASATDADLQAWLDETNKQAAESEKATQEVQQKKQEEQTKAQTLEQQIAALGQQVTVLTAQNVALGKQVAALSAVGKAGE